MQSPPANRMTETPGTFPCLHVRNTDPTCIREASNGIEAIEQYRKNAADITLVVTDIDMPQMDGYQLVVELKKLGPGLPIIVSSGFGDAIVTSKITPEAIAGLISKPYNFVQVQEVLQSVLEGLHVNVATLE